MNSREQFEDQSRENKPWFHSDEPSEMGFPGFHQMRKLQCACVLMQNIALKSVRLDKMLFVCDVSSCPLG